MTKPLVELIEAVTNVEAKAEELREIPGYPGYFISRNGSIESRVRKNPIRMVPKLTHTGYLWLSLRTQGVAKKKSVASLVLTAYVGDRPPGYEASHLNGVRTDNRLENLAWASKHENCQQKRYHGTYNAGENHPRSKISKKDADYIRENYTRYGPRRSNAPDLALRFGISRTHVHSIMSGESWSDDGKPILEKETSE